MLEEQQERHGLNGPYWKSWSTFVARKLREADMIVTTVTVAMTEATSEDTTDTITTATTATATRWTGQVATATATTVVEEGAQRQEIPQHRRGVPATTMEKTVTERPIMEGADQVYLVDVVGHPDITWEVPEVVGVEEEPHIMEGGACKLKKNFMPHPYPWKVSPTKKKKKKKKLKIPRNLWHA